MTAREPSGHAVVAWIEGALGRGARMVSIERMPPSATEQQRVVVSIDDGTLALVLRRYHDAARLGTDPW